MLFLNDKIEKWHYIFKSCYLIKTIIIINPIPYFIEKWNLIEYSLSCNKVIEYKDEDAHLPSEIWLFSVP